MPRNKSEQPTPQQVAVQEYYDVLAKVWPDKSNNRGARDVSRHNLALNKAWLNMQAEDRCALTAMGSIAERFAWMDERL